MTPKRTSADAEQTRMQLVHAGRVLFGSAGFATTKATDIAELAGVTRGRCSTISSTRRAFRRSARGSRRRGG
jgi:hypothetical protein